MSLGRRNEKSRSPFPYRIRTDHPSPPTPQDKMSKEEIIRSLQAAESYWEKGSYAPTDSSEPKQQQQQQRLSRSTQRRSNDLNNASQASSSRKEASSSSKESSPLNSSPTAPPSSSPSSAVAAAVSNGTTPVHPSSRSPFVVESMSEDKVPFEMVTRCYEYNICLFRICPSHLSCFTNQITILRELSTN